MVLYYSKSKNIYEVHRVTIGDKSNRNHIASGSRVGENIVED